MSARDPDSMSVCKCGHLESQHATRSPHVCMVVAGPALLQSGLCDCDGFTATHSASPLAHVQSALKALSIEAQNTSESAKFDMCLAEDINRVGRQLPSPWLKDLENRVREAWVEMKMAEDALGKLSAEGKQ